MLNKAEGIVLRQVKYSDNSRILTVYTREKGKCGYFLGSTGRKKGGRAAAATQPLSVVELLVHERKTEKALGRIKEIRIAVPAISTRENIIKTSIVLFLTEIINKCIHEEEKNEQLYDYLRSAVISLEHLDQNIPNFHLHFLIRLSSYLGFRIHGESMAEGYCFDLTEGVFVPVNPAHGHVLEPQTAAILGKLIQIEHTEACPMSREQRNKIMEGLLIYYRLHLHDFGQVKSHQVLSQVLG